MSVAALALGGAAAGAVILLGDESDSGDKSTGASGLAGADAGATAPEDECPVLSNADAAEALGVESVTMETIGTICTWETPEGQPALQVIREKPATRGSPAEQAKSWGINGCLEDPREVTVTGGYGVACEGGYKGQGAAFTGDYQYLVSIGDPYANLSDAEEADRVDTAAEVLARLTLPGA